jgi:hypothetical protein
LPLRVVAAGNRSHAAGSAPIDGRPPLVKRSLNVGEKVWIAAIDPDFV